MEKCEKCDYTKYEKEIDDLKKQIKSEPPKVEEKPVKFPKSKEIKKYYFSGFN